MKAIYLMSSEQVLGNWERILPLLCRIPNYFESTKPEYILDRLIKGDLQMWALTNNAVYAIIVTEICTMPEEKVFRFVGCAGMEFDQFISIAEDVFDKTARTLGCSRAELVASRRGWSRKLEQLGSKFEFRYEILSRPVTTQKEM